MTTQEAISKAATLARVRGFELDELRLWRRGPQMQEANAAKAVVYHTLRDAGWSVPAIGRFMHRDHTSVMYMMARYDANGIEVKTPVEVQPCRERTLKKPHLRRVPLEERLRYWMGWAEDFLAGEGVTLADVRDLRQVHEKIMRRRARLAHALREHGLSLVFIGYVIARHYKAVDALLVMRDERGIRRMTCEEYRNRKKKDTAK